MIPSIFEFESQSIRVVTDETGIPWFSANDVCAILGYSNSRKALSDHVDGEDVTKRDTPTSGGKQRQNHINEPGLYALVLGSTKPEAKRFKRWVTAEVLPSIRKTGTYAVPTAVPALLTSTQDRVHAIITIGEAVSRVAGVKHGIAMAATLTVIHENTGLSVDSLRKVLPAATEPICSLNPTQLGERLQLSARAVNMRLQASGFQFKNDRDEWELSAAGQRWAEALPFSRNGHAGYQILWNIEVSHLLKEIA